MARSSDVRVAELICTLSLAEDVGIGLHPEHCLRTSYVATRTAQQLGLGLDEQQDVYHTALLKDAGCTSWNSQLALMLGGDDMAARKEALFFSDLASERDAIGWTFKYVGAGSPLPRRAARVADFFAHGRNFMREGFMNAGEVAARMAARLGTSANTQAALRSLFERWDGKGMPLGLR
jgi:response regulator RpfG family c-di-GMP phosphodiesterase